MTKISNQYSLTNILTADLANSRLGINNVSPAYSLDVTGTARVTSTIISQANGSTFGNASATGRALIIQAGSTNQAIMLKNAAGGDGTISATGTSTSLNYSFSTYSVADALYIANAGNVGIGTSSPSQVLDVRKATASGDTQFNFLNSQNSSAGNTSVTSTIYLGFCDDSAGVANANKIVSGKSGDYTSGPNANSFLAFHTTNANTTSERMRITGVNVLIAKSNDTTPAETITGLQFNGARILCTVDGTYNAFSRLNSDGDIITFHRGTTTKVGSISVTSSVTSYNMTSDYRLKEDLQQINGLEKVSAIKVYNYKWKIDNSRMDGVLAHELQEVLPYAVTGKKDGEDMQSVDYSKLVPVLVKAIQELSAENTSLINRIEALENK